MFVELPVIGTSRMYAQGLPFVSRMLGGVRLQIPKLHRCDSVEPCVYLIMESASTPCVRILIHEGERYTTPRTLLSPDKLETRRD